MLGKIIDNRFEVIEKIGEGGMAAVYLCLDRENGEKVALKVLSTSSKSKESYLRFKKREFALTKRVNNPNVITLHQFGSIDEKNYYTVMEFVEGRDLQQKIDTEGPLSEELTKEIILKLAKALKALHHVGVTHRDLKPGNIMMKNGNEPIVMDLGLARAVDITQLTETGAILGTPVYMSPELAEGQRVDERSDLYQLGAICFTMLTGQPPFTETNIVELLKKVISAEPPPVTSVSPTLSPNWNPIISRCLHKDPDKRFQSAEELISSLENMSLLDDERERPTAGIAQVREHLAKESTDLEKDSRTQSELNLPVTPVSRPAHASQEKQTPLRTTAMTLALLLMCLLIVFDYLSSKESHDIRYNVTNLQVVSSVNSMTITWQSAIPYPTVVRFQSPYVLVVQRANRDATKEHRLVVDGLKENCAYTFEVLFPNKETSLLQKANTEKFRINLLEGKESDSRLSLKLRVLPPPLSMTCVGRGNEAISVESSITTSGLLHLVIGGPAWKLEDIDFKAEYRLHHIFSESLRKLANVQCDHLMTELATIDEQDLFAKMAKSSATPTGIIVDKLVSKNYEKPTEMIKKHLDEELDIQRKKYPRFFSNWERACSLSQLLLMTKILPLKKRVAFDNSLDTMMALGSFYTYSCLEQFPYQIAPRGMFAFAEEQFHGEFVEIPLLERSSTSPLRLGQSLSIRLPAQEKWSKEFELGDLSAYDRSELAFELLRFSNAIVKIRINEKHDLQLLGHRQMSKHGLIPFQRLPIEMLHKGYNKIAMHFIPFAPFLIAKQVEIQKISLRLYKDSDG